jgi:hypothetical protein
MKSVLYVLGFAMVMASSVAIAEEPETEKPAAAAKVCKRLTETGSRVGSTRVCKTADEWKRLETEAKDNARRLQQVRGATKGG